MFQRKSVEPNLLKQDLLGWHNVGSVDALKYYKDNQYENGYGSIQAITKQFFTIMPYAIDARGKRIKQTNITDVLARPNQDMSGLDFREALSIMGLIHNKVYVRVHYKGNKPTESNIYGFTFLEGVTEVDYDDGRTVYRDCNGELLYEKDVIVLKNINPYDLSKGYSTANAARNWARIDDYIASYQAGFFENGAVPAGQFLISAPTSQEFEDIVRNLKKTHRGSDKNNNVVYDYAPVDPMTGKPVASSITWVPFNTTNKDLALGEVFEQVNKKIDSAYGVPASVRGVNDNNTYASVRVDQEIFINNAVRPFTLKIWTRFTHELNRITGGLGYALTFDLEAPSVAEEEKAIAETQKTTVETLLSLLDKGYTLESAVKALNLPDEYLDLFKPEVAPVSPQEPTEDIPEVDEGEEVEEAPEVEEKALEPLSVSCKHCGRYLFKATGTTVVEDMPCPRCKATLNFKIINPKGDDVTHMFTFAEKAPEKLKEIGVTDEQK